MKINLIKIAILFLCLNLFQVPFIPKGYKNHTAILLAPSSPLESLQVFYAEVSGRAEASEGEAPYIIGLAGPSGVGKTTYANGALKEELEKRGRKVLVISMDSFFKDEKERQQLKEAGDGWSPEHVRIQEARRVLRLIKENKKEIRTERYVRNQIRKIESWTIDLEGIDTVIFEGLYALSRESSLGNWMEFVDLPLYMEADRELIYGWRWGRELAKKTLAREKEKFDHYWQYDLMPDFRSNILPSRVNASFILTADPDHRLTVKSNDRSSQSNPEPAIPHPVEVAI